MATDFHEPVKERVEDERVVRTGRQADAELVKVVLLIVLPRIAISLNSFLHRH